MTNANNNFLTADSEEFKIFKLYYYLETHPDNYYDDVMRILKYVGPQICPTVYGFLREELECFDLEHPSFPQIHRLFNETYQTLL